MKKLTVENSLQRRHGLHHTTESATIKKVLLLRRTLTLWRCTAEVIAPFLLLLFQLCYVGRVTVTDC